MENFDVAIIGGGPAGSISSYYLSQKGLKVALLEKNDIGRDKICGGGLSDYTLRELPFSLPSSIVERYIKGINFISPKNEIFQKKEIDEIGITTYRSMFDAYLTNKSINAGTTFYPHTKVTKIDKSNGKFIISDKFSSEYIIGADGANSIVKRNFHLDDKKSNVNLALRSVIHMKESEVEEFMIDPETYEFYFSNHNPGYGWIFALRDSINIGIGMKMNFSNPRKLLKDYVKRCFNLRGKQVPPFEIEGFPIPNARLPKKFSKDGVFLIGDAAGLVDPVSGEGVHYAIRSGKIVADSILKAFSDNSKGNIDLLYKRQIQHDIGNDLFVSYRLNFVLEKFFLNNMNFWFNLLKRNPFIFNYAGEIAMKSNYYAVYKKVLEKLPKITLQTIFPTEKLVGYTYNQDFVIG